MGDFCKNESELKTARSKIKRDVEDASVKKYLQWQSSVGVRQKTQSIASHLADDEESFVPEPCAALSAVSLLTWRPPISRDIPMMLGAIQKIPENRTDLRTCVDAAEEKFAKRTQCVRHCSAPPIKPRPVRKPHEKPRCGTVRCCICGEAGTLVWKFKKLFVASLNRLMKRFFLRDDLADGQLVMEWVSDLDAGEHEHIVGPVRFFHFSHPIWSPFGPCVRGLRFVEVLPNGHTLLRATDTYYHFWELILHLRDISRLQHQANLSLHRLHNSDMRLGGVDTRRVEVERAHGADDSDVWRFPGRHTHGTSVDDALDRLGDGSSDGGSGIDDADGDEKGPDAASSEHSVVISAGDKTPVMSEFGGDVDSEELFGSNDEKSEEDPAPTTPEPDVAAPTPSNHSDPSEDSSSSSASDSSSSSSSTDTTSDSALVAPAPVADVAPAVSAARKPPVFRMETPHGEIRIYDNGKAVAYCSAHGNKCQKKKEHTLDQSDQTSQPHQHPARVPLCACASF